MKLRKLVFIDSGCYSELDDNVRLLVSQDTGELDEFLADPYLYQIDMDCPNTHYVTIPIKLLLESFLRENPDALQDLMAASDPQEITFTTDAFPPEMDVPGSAEHTMSIAKDSDFQEEFEE